MKKVLPFEGFVQMYERRLAEMSAPAARAIAAGNMATLQPLTDPWFEAFVVARELVSEGYVNMDPDVTWLLENTWLGYVGYDEANAQTVPFDYPMLLEKSKGYNAATGKTVTFDNPTRVTKADGRPDKAFKVYRPAEGYHQTSDGRKIRKAKVIYFGDPDSPIRNSNPEAAKSFRARHKCSQKKDKDTPGWWSCNIARFPSAGLSSTRPW